jgi:prephenate dehydrogenase
LVGLFLESAVRGQGKVLGSPSPRPLPPAATARQRGESDGREKWFPSRQFSRRPGWRLRWSRALPLPGGEGRGEGEGSDQRPTPSFCVGARGTPGCMDLRLCRRFLTPVLAARAFLLLPRAVFLLNSVVRFQKITIVGVGLLGGSLGLALRKRRLAGEVVGYVRRAASVVECRKAGAVDRATQDLQAAVSGADVIVLCTPLSRMRPLVRQLLPAVKPGAIITDVGSVKAGVIRELESMITRAGARFVGSHPMAGAEKSGVSAARADLFADAACVVTPTPRTLPGARRAVEGLWKAVGGRVLRLDPETHDLLVSRSSHLPHITAAALSSLVLNPALPKAQALLCANGFRDTTRIASGSIEMWRDIALANRRNLARALDGLITDLRKFQQALKAADQARITRFLRQAKHRRDGWSARGGALSTE